ncbi:MAG: pyridoxamine 5'-phosphate oxidase family protein [Pseudomonadota bacterium]
MPTTGKLNETLQKFIEAQPMFFVATAAKEGRVNVSPKGMDTLKVMDQQTIVWLNLTGSGNETAAHVREFPRMTLMFCEFAADARIVRVYGEAAVIHPHDSDWHQYAGHFDEFAGSRQVFRLAIDLVQTSCGTGVPKMTLDHQRGPEELLPFYEEMGEEGVREYWRRKNLRSIDGKPTGTE